MGKVLKIIFVEDSACDSDLINYELKRSKLVYTYEIVETREAYESALDIFRPDIIISDYSLPSFDGLSAFHIKQKKYPEIPFIIVSGSIGEENAVELIKNGVIDYALKDKLFTLAHKITRALEDAERKKQKKLADDILKHQYEKLYEIAFLQSHQVRGPVATILGLISLFDFDNPNESFNTDVIKYLQEATISLDKVIHMIVQKTNEIHVV